MIRPWLRWAKSGSPSSTTRSGRSSRASSATLFDDDIPGRDGSESWVDALLRAPEHRAAVEQEVRAVAEEIAADPQYADDEPIAPDESTRDRFRAFAREHLGRG